MTYGQIAVTIVLSGLGFLIFIGSILLSIYIIKEGIKYLKGGEMNVRKRD